MDEAALRRMTKKVYIPLPGEKSRKHLIVKLLKEGKVRVSKSIDIDKIVEETEDYSCSDITLICKEAAMEPIRSYGDKLLKLDLEPKDVRGITLQDFESALDKVRPSVSQRTIQEFETWSVKKGL